ncbi:MAG: ribbon-helix-helix domain-containing protein [Candidatus Binatia bacterium]
MAKSVRFSHEQEALLEQAARALGVSQSKLIREAIDEKCRGVLRPPLAQSLAPLIGRIKSTGGRARKTGTAFKRAFRERGRK